MNEDSTIDATRKTVRIYLAINEHGEIYVDKDCAKDAVDGLCREWDCAATIELAVTVDPPQIEVISVTVPALSQAAGGGERIVNKERAHTPGPWTVEDCTSKLAGFLGVKDGTDHICDIFPFGARPGASDRPIEQHRANARLIAAAPDLLDFARNVAGLDDRLLLNVDVLKQWRDDARAAIAKVEGTL